MKKIFCIIVSAIVFISMFCGCGTANTNNKKLSVVATIFPEYDWVKSIAGEKAKDIDLTLLLNSGVDLHSYQPTAKDIIKISKCDLFIYVGGESDEWAQDAIKEASNKNMQVINLMDVLENEKKEEEAVEGMQVDEEEEEEGEEEVEYDEHVWLSVKNAQKCCEAIKNSLSKLDKDNESVYQKNYDTYSKELATLDSEFSNTVKNAKRNTLLFGDRFPFRYLIEDYSLKYYAAFIGCSAESEASFETISFLAKKVDELKLPYVITLDGSDQKIAKTIIKNTKDKSQQIVTMNSMQSTFSDGDNYLNIMQSNLDTLKKVLY